jgi:hypothetical protein
VILVVISLPREGKNCSLHLRFETNTKQLGHRSPPPNPSQYHLATPRTQLYTEHQDRYSLPGQRPVVLKASKKQSDRAGETERRESNVKLWGDDKRSHVRA